MSTKTRATIAILAAFTIAVCFFIVHNQVVNFNASSTRISYFFSPECSESSAPLETTILSAMNCFNATMGCSYQYINPVWDYSQVSHKPWFASLAIFTIIYLSAHLIFFVVSYCAIIQHEQQSIIDLSIFKWQSCLFVIISMLLILACYLGYVNAPDIRVCAPTSTDSVGTNTTTIRSHLLTESFDDLLAGCSYVFTKFTNPTAQWVRDATKGSAEDGGICKNFHYFEEGGRLEANIAVQSSPYLKELIEDNKSQIRIYLYIAIASALAILLPYLVEFFQCRAKCRCNCCRNKDEVDAVKSLLPPY